MPPNDFQRRVLQVVASNRTPESHIAGGLALNRNFARLSFDIDVFHDKPDEVAASAEADAAALRAHGLGVDWTRRLPTIWSATITDGVDRTEMDWAHDSGWRFFPPAPDPLFGYALHPFDLATNKALAAANRRVPRDVIDLVTVHERLYPLGAVVWAAPAKDEGYGPLLLLEHISRFGRYHREDYAKVPGLEAYEPADVSRRLTAALAEAREFVDRMPDDLVGVAFLQDGGVVQPDPARVGCYEQRRAARGGLWPGIPSLDALS